MPLRRAGTPVKQASWTSALQRTASRRAEPVLGPRKARTRVRCAASGARRASQLPRIAEGERRHPSRVLVQDQGPRDRRFGALAAVFAFAEPAVDADRRAF